MEIEWGDVQDLARPQDDLLHMPPPEQREPPGQHRHARRCSSAREMGQQPAATPNQSQPKITDATADVRSGRVVVRVKLGLAVAWVQPREHVHAAVVQGRRKQEPLRADDLRAR